MLDIMRHLGYNEIVTEHYAVFLFDQTPYLSYYQSSPVSCQTANCSVTRALASAQAGLTILNAKTATIRFAGKVTVSKRIITMCLRQEALYHRRFTPVNTFLKISQALIPNIPSESPGGLWQVVGDSAAFSNLFGGSSNLLSTPRMFLSLSPVSTSAPGGSLPGTGGLSQGGTA